MTELLQLEAELNVLEIGTGCGYQTAVLAELVTQVYSVEIIPELAENARTQLDSLGYQNITLKVGNGYNGWEEHAPYGRIIVTAAPKVLPNRLIEQLAEGGRMIIPIGNYDQELVLISKTARGIEQTKVIGVRFVPMTGAIDDK
jgi:protein-L-isoaspartate(D-aspartate) O-methyltransferase